MASSSVGAIGCGSDVIVATAGSGTDGDSCPDFTTTGDLKNFAFSAITLKCADTYSATTATVESNKLLGDFDVAISWQQNSSPS